MEQMQPVRRSPPPDLTTPIGVSRGGVKLFGRCRFGHQRELQPLRLAVLHGDKTPLEEIGPLLRCPACNAKGLDFVITRRPETPEETFYRKDRRAPTLGYHHSRGDKASVHCLAPLPPHGNLCRHRAELDLPALVAAGKGNMTLIAAERAARCQQCRRKGLGRILITPNRLPVADEFIDQ
ncbi:hypothetical protein [Ferrovibrio terrae]|uniref:hypothetical protein n=1 Tax=Ferrovibrio terrae TaxID=2594003 RepID=UPI003137AA7B